MKKINLNSERNILEGNILEPVNCNLCGSNDYKIIYSPQYDKVSQQELAEKFRSSGDELLIDQLVECKNCGLQYINPRIRADLILKGYSEGTDENFISQADSREKTFAQQLKYIETLMEKNSSKGKNSSIAKDNSSAKNNLTTKGKIYDIGTAGGSFLQAAKKRGWEVYGSEPNKWLCQWGKEHYGIEIQSGDLFSAQRFDSEFFEAVTLWDVLEHVPDPTKYLQEIKRILKKEGLLVVNYPDIGSWLSKLMKRKWIFLLSVHLYYFNRRTIRKMLEKNGFELIKIKPHFQTLGLGYLTWRMKAYSNIIHKIAAPVVKTLKLDSLQIPYWLGQTLVIAKKR